VKSQRSFHDSVKFVVSKENFSKENSARALLILHVHRNQRQRPPKDTKKLVNIFTKIAESAGKLYESFVLVTQTAGNN
jgi:hypothetical protein